MSTRRKIDRVSRRPNPFDWQDDEHMTLEEARAVYWPDGPLTVTSLRTEIRHGRLTAERIAGKLLITPLAIREMRTKCRERQKDRASTSGSAKGAKPSSSSGIQAALKRAQVSALANAARRKERLKAISHANT